MAAIAVQDADGGAVLDVDMTAATEGGDTVAYGNRAAGHNLQTVYLVVQNSHSADWDVTIGGEDGVTYTVPFGATKVALIPVNRGYGRGSVEVTYEGVTALAVGAVRI